eukprot:3364234-Ditylum_brightwellii.AAC.1
MEVKTIDVSTRVDLCCCIFPTVKLGMQEYEKACHDGLRLLYFCGIYKDPVSLQMFLYCLVCFKLIIPCRGFQTPLRLQSRVSSNVWAEDCQVFPFMGQI